MESDRRAQILQAILDADRLEANRLVDEWALDHGYEKAVAELLLPILETVGVQWIRTRETSLAQAYVAAKVAEDVMTRVLEERQQRGGPAPALRGPVVVANIEDDYHPLGRKMVTAFLRLEGWEVHDLGVDVRAGAIVDAAVALGARVVGASAMMYTTARNIQALRDEIDRRGLTGRIQMAVGGAVFRLRPELVAEVGGDGTAPTALQVPALFEELWQRSLEVAPGDEGAGLLAEQAGQA